MDCDEIIGLISEYIDDDIDGLMRDILEEHLRICERCNAFLHTMEKTVSLSRKASRRRKVPEKLISRVSYEIRIRYKK